MKFYKRDPDRALSGMAELSLKQRGAYNSLLDLLYSRDGDVPDDDQRVARMMTCHWREWKAVKEELMALGKVWSEGGRLHAKRVQETIKEAARFSQDQSTRASSGWEKRKKDNENSDGEMPSGNASTPTATPTAIDRGGANAPHARATKPHVDPPGPGAIRAEADAKRAQAQRWPEFRATYPKREGGQSWPAAEKKYTAFVASGVPEEAIITGARVYAAHLARTGQTGTRFVKHALSWLNQRGWEDEYLTGTGRRQQSDLMDAIDTERREAEARAGYRSHAQGSGVEAWPEDEIVPPR